MTPISRLLLAGLLGLAGGCAEEQVLKGELRVCLGENDMPRAAQHDQQGFDVEFSRLLAKELFRTFTPVWLPTPNPTEIESTDLDFSFLVYGRCDIQMSIPGQDALPESSRLQLTAAYYGTAFELIPATAAGNLKDLRGDKIAVRANTVAHIVVDRYKMSWTMKRDSSEIVSAVETGEVAVGLIWGPELALFDVSASESFEAPSVLRWNQHIAVRHSDLDLLTRINDILAQAATRKQILALLQQYRIPQHAPFSATYRSSDLNEL